MRAAIVDPFSSGALLTREFARRGTACVMVGSTPEVPAMYRSSCHLEQFAATIQYRGDLEETCRQLERWDVGCVLAGCELGVVLADQLSERLGVTSNGTSLTAARRNKHLMAQAAADHGLPTPAFCASSSLNELLNWAKRHGSFPYVAKPVDSSGSDGVQLCCNDIDIESAFGRIINQRNVFGVANRSVFLQQYVSGTQYAVDTVSCEGQHGVAAFWKYGKPAFGSSFFGDDSVELLPDHDTLHQKLTPTVFAALEALGIRHGPAHCELICDDDTSWFIEIGARLHGGGNPELSRLCGARSQIELTVQACLQPPRFLAEIGGRYELSGRAIRVFLTPQGTGRLQALNGLAEIERLPSFHEMHISDKIGQAVPRILGWVVLLHADAQVIHRDRQRIRQLEQHGLYQIEPLK